MDQGMLGKVSALRDEAFATLKALDDAVVTLGGKSRLTTVVSAVGTASGHSSATAAGEGVRRVSQSGAAELILRERGEPTSGAELLKALPSKGVILLGRNSLINFTSAMSKSGKFRSVRRQGGYYWWFKDERVPPGWNDEAPDLLNEQPDASSVHSNQEGGEANATAT